MNNLELVQHLLKVDDVSRTDDGKLVTAFTSLRQGHFPPTPSDWLDGELSSSEICGIRDHLYDNPSRRSIGSDWPSREESAVESTGGRIRGPLRRRNSTVISRGRERLWRRVM